MEITVDCYGVTERLSGGAEHVIFVPPDSRIVDLLTLLAVRWPDLAHVLPTCAYAIGDAVVPASRPLCAGERLALLPPVSGG